MKAVLLRAYGGVDQLSYEDVPDPEPQSGEVVVRSIATSINPVDWKLRSGIYKDRMPLKLPAILGRDIAGEVVALGEGVTGLSVGEVVFGLVNQAYAELAPCKAGDLAMLPEGLAPVDAGALPLILTTGSQLVESGVKPRSGQTVLVTGALGSVGRTAVHVAKQHGARVIAGVRGSEAAKAAELGAASVVAIDDPKAIEGLPELDAIADTVGGDAIGQLLPKLKKDGVLASVVGKPKAAEGLYIRVEDVRAQPDPARLVQLASDVQQGQLSIPIGRYFKLADIREAQQTAENGHAGGKVVVTP